MPVNVTRPCREQSQETVTRFIAEEEAAAEIRFRWLTTSGSGRRGRLPWTHRYLEAGGSKPLRGHGKIWGRNEKQQSSRWQSKKKLKNHSQQRYSLALKKQAQALLRID